MIKSLFSSGRLKVAGITLIAVLISAGCIGLMLFLLTPTGKDVFWLYRISVAGAPKPSPVRPFLDTKNVSMVHIPAGSFQMGGDPQVKQDACKKYTKSSC